jgi:rhodanese-related sulfurtransferase
MFSQFFSPGIRQIEPGAAKDKLGQELAPFLLDVREPEEYRQGHIAGSKLIPLGQLQQRLPELPRDREIICVCHSGSRSSSATRALASAGYSAVNLRGGMLGWSRAGLPVQKGIV